MKGPECGEEEARSCYVRLGDLNSLEDRRVIHENQTRLIL
jgi:hypothetical protein